MNALLLQRSISVLPPPAQQELADYVTFLCYKYKTSAPNSEPKQVERLPLKFGAGKHLIAFVADDFDAPLDHFKEYTL